MVPLNLGPSAFPLQDIIDNHTPKLWQKIFPQVRYIEYSFNIFKG